MAGYVRITSSATIHFSRRSQSTFNGEHVRRLDGGALLSQLAKLPGALDLARKSSLARTSLPCTWAVLTTTPGLKPMFGEPLHVAWSRDHYLETLENHVVAAATPCEMEEAPLYV